MDVRPIMVHCICRYLVCFVSNVYHDVHSIQSDSLSLEYDETSASYSIST